MNSIGGLLRELPVFARPLPSFATGEPPGGPEELFASWLREAAAAGVVEPHAATLSTVDEQGVPDARVVLLADLDERGWRFAATASSPKGQQLARQPAVALSFYWREQGRQVRVRGTAAALDPETSARDFLRRPEDSRIAGLVGRQSQPLLHLSELDQAVAAAARVLADDRGTVAPDHTVYVVSAASVEFWQGHPHRRHTRLRYRRSAERGWFTELLWP